MKKIVQKDAAVLRQKAKPVPIEKIATPEIKHTIQDMRQALASQEDGVALAAPQIAVPLRLFIISEKIFGEEGPKPSEPLVYINPTLLQISKEKELVHEGCLSVRGIYGKIKRATKATVEAYGKDGKKFTRGASGLLAQIFQHEVDHLNGILFIDTATELEELDQHEVA